MSVRLSTLILSLWLLGPAWAHAEVLIRWDHEQIPSRESLGLSTVVVPAERKALVKNALAAGYRVWLEVPASALATFVPPTRGVAGILVKGDPTPARLSSLQRRLAASGLAVRVLDERGKWPHIRSNNVTTNDAGVLQVSSRTAQPWVENNAALMRIAETMRPGVKPIVTYAWLPETTTDKEEGPALEDYLVAIAEADGYGADLLLPLHERFQQQLLMGLPRTRASWKAIRQAMDFYAWDLPARYRRTADVGVVTGADPMRWFEVMNLLSRHNLPFELIVQDALPARDLAKLDLLVVLDPPDTKGVKVLQTFAAAGGVVVLAGVKGDFPWHGAAPKETSESATTWNVEKGQVVEIAQPVADPNEFALQMRRLVGDRRRVIQIWNGITVLAAHFTAPQDDTALVTLVNYAELPVEVQLRVPGLFTAVHYESPGEEPILLPHTQRDGFTELVVPELRVGARLFLTGASPTSGKPSASSSSPSIDSVYAPDDFELTADPSRPEWADAPRVVANRNYLDEPIAGAPMEIRSRWTDGHLYLLFTCPYDALNLKPDPNASAETPRLWNWDVAEAFIGSDPAHVARYKEFQVSPQGEWVDLDIDRDHQDRQQGMKWSSGYAVKARVDAEAKVWYGEMRIPFKALDVPAPKKDTALRIGLYRISGVDPRQYYAWRPTGEKSFHVPEAFGALRLR